MRSKRDSSASRSKATITDNNNDTETIEGYSLQPDSGIISSSSPLPPPNDSFAYLDDGHGTRGVDAKPQSAAASNKTVHEHIISQSSEEQSQSEKIDNEYHFGSSNPFGPLNVREGGGKTTKATSTSAAEPGRSGDETQHWTHTTVWTTVLPNGEAYRTTRVVGLSRKRSQDKHRQAIATPLTTCYEKSIPLGPTQRIILTYNQQPHYDGSYVQTTEFIRANNGSITVKHQKFSAKGVKLGEEDIVEYPPMQIASRSRSRVGILPRPANNKYDNKQEVDEKEEVTTTISELTNTFAGNTYATSDVCDDRTRDPTVVNYNAGYSEEMARKHSSQAAASGEALEAAEQAEAEVAPQEQLKIGSNWSTGTENYSNPEYMNGQENWRAGADGDYVSCSASTRSRRRRSRFLLVAAICLLVAFILAIGAAVGATVSRRGGGSADPINDSVNTADTDTNGGSGEGGGSASSEGDGGGSATPAPSVSARTPKTPTASPSSMSDVFANAGFDRHWPSEDGWIVAPSFASFISGGQSDIFQVSSSYYDSYYLSNLPECVEQCNANDAVGGAYFDLSSQNKRSVCLCYKEAECYDPNLVFSGGFVFLKEEHFIPTSQICQMSTCGYFPADPICDGLDIIGVEALVELELRKVVGLMVDEDLTVFEQTCADFLNDRFSQTESSVEGVRCSVVSQDLSGRRARNMRRADSSAQYLQGVFSDDSLEISLRITGLFLRTDRYPDAESVDFGENVIHFFDREGDDFVQYLERDAEIVGTDYYEEVVDINIMGSAVPVAVPVPTPSPITPTDEPSPLPTRNPTLKPSRLPVPWPTTEPPSQRPTRRPTRKPTKAPSKKPTKAPSPKLSRMPVPWTTTASPSNRPTRRPTPRPSRKPTPKPSRKPTPRPTERLTPRPSKRPTPRPTRRPTPKPFPVPTQVTDPSAVKFCRGSSCWVQIGSTITGQKGDQLGDSVRFDASGTRFSVSASLSSESGRDEAGFVKVYDVDGSDFVQVGQTLYGFDPGDEVKGILSGNGRRLAMYSHRRDNYKGRVWIYELQSGEWVEIGRIIGKEEGEKFGKSVAFTSGGDIIAIGAPFSNSQRGVVRVYRQKGNSWQQFGSELRGTIRDAKFGWDVALASDTLMLVVGQKEDSGQRGQVIVFQWNGGATDGLFEQFGNAIEGDGSGDDFGRAVAISASGTIVAAGARFHDGPNGDNSGQVKAFSYYGGGSWVQTPFFGSNIVGDGEDDEMMNVALNARGNRLAAGGGSGNDDTGYVRVFDNTGDGWKQVGGRLSGSKPSQKFGSNFDISPDGNRLLVGSPGRENEKIRGEVQLFELVKRTLN